MTSVLRVCVLCDNNVLYSIPATVYRLTTRWQVFALKLSMKRRLPKSRLAIVAAAGVPSEGAI
jgi:hypothetical protein